MVHRYWARTRGLRVERTSSLEREAMVPLSQSSFRSNRTNRTYSVKNNGVTNKKAKIKSSVTEKC